MKLAMKVIPAHDLSDSCYLCLFQIAFPQQYARQNYNITIANRFLELNIWNNINESKCNYQGS